MDVFVYGTLTDPGRVARVLSEFEFRGAATLDGLHRVEGEYPTLAPGGTASGRILRTTEIEELDAYEGVERGLYVRVAVPWAGSDSDGGERESETVQVYVGDPDALGADIEWPEAERGLETGVGQEVEIEAGRESETFAERVRQFLRENEVVVRPDESA